MPGFGYGAFGGSAFGALGDLPPDLGEVIGITGVTARALRRYPDMTASALATTLATSAHWHSLFAALEVGDVSAADVLANLTARVNAAGTVHLNAVLAGSAADSVAFLDSVMAAWQLLLAEDLATADAAAANVRKLAALIDVLAATGQAHGSLAAFAACTSALALEGLLKLGYAADAVDQVVLADTASAIAKLLGPLVDGLLVNDSALPMLRLSVIAAETTELGDDPGALLRANVALADAVLFYATIRLGGTDYVGWVMNTDLKAASEHRNVAFDAFASFKGKDYAAGPNGLVQFTGDTDGDGAPIAASIRTALYDFGTSKFKRVPEAFIGATADGQLLLKTLTREPQTGRLVEDWYRVERLPADGPGTGRAKPGRGLKSTYWQFVLTNVDGADFALDKIELRPLYLDRRT